MCKARLPQLNSLLINAPGAGKPPGITTIESSYAC